MEADASYGVFNFDKRASKDAGTSDTNTACHLCGTKKENTEAKKMYRCKGCEFSQYCSPECQRADWQSHKSGCQEAIQYRQFGQTFLNFLRHPKLKHYLSVAIILDGKPLDESEQLRAKTCYTVHLEIAIRHEEKDFPRALTQGIQILFSTKRPEDLTAVDTGYFSFHRGINCERGDASRLGQELWNLAKETQKESDASRAYNPVVIMNWVWNGTSMGCGLELSPEAFQDAKNDSIREEMRLDGGSGPKKIEFVEDRCTLLGDIDAFVAKDTENKLGLRMKMSMHDKRILLILIADALPEFLAAQQGS
ncbi:hypothetical protein BJ165DRAFT_1501563 [Panaeolus papilionaceus]|nr:hypothetical protein BJ165DRAFT_1501563 [Panaeolus papilionaceus]